MYIAAHHLFTQLPTPKPSKELYPEEEDDEFLKKKPLPEQLPQKPPPITKAERKPAKIMLPSLSDVSHVSDTVLKLKSEII